MKKTYVERITTSFTTEEVEKVKKHWPHIERLDHILCAEIHIDYHEWDEVSVDEYPHGCILRLSRKKVFEYPVK